MSEQKTSVDEISVEPTESTPFVTISETALNQLNAVVEQQGRDDLFLRLYVQGASGGISFGMALDSRRSDDDHTCIYEGIEVAVDRISFPYLDGANVDFVEDKDGGKSGFQISSPNADLMAASGGGCGSCSGGAGCC